MIARPVPVTLGSPDSTTLDADDFLLVHARFPANAFLAPHVHERATFGVMLSGGFDLDFPGHHFSCTPSSVFVEPAGERHSNRITPLGAEVLAIQPAPGAGAGEKAWHALFTEVSFRRHGRIATLASRIVTEIRQPDPFSELAAHGLIVDMLVAALRDESRRASQRRPSPEVLMVRELLHDGAIAEARIPALAARVGMPASRLCREFRRHYGESVASYARRARTEHAAHLLVTTDRGIAAIALATGFVDQSHLTRAFNRQYGTTPGGYRRRYRPRP
jgi:AraC-like DNA-binding protein